MRSLALLFALAVTSRASAAGPTCALLDPEKTPRAALLEAKLLAEPGATWVERASIDAVLKEQKLQAMFSPQGVGERVRLGKLLKADLLVMVRPVRESKEPALEVVVSETAGGLRLLVRGVPMTKDADADIAAMLSAARDGIRKHGEKIAEVVAVPPFVSNDLEFTHDHLKGAFAKLAEAEALDRKGVLVVELEEAEALAKEIALAAPGTTPARPLPVYLLGEYRNDGKGKEATLSLKLRAERGGKPIGKPDAVAGRPEEAPAAVRKWSAGVLDALAKDGRPRPPADPKAEAKQLAERAKTFRRLGSSSEVLALVEASLLLDPAQPDLHVDAIKALTPLLAATWPKGYQSLREFDRAAALYRRALGHLEAFYARDGKGEDYLRTGEGFFASDLTNSVNRLMITGTPGRELTDRLEELRKEERETLLRVLPIEARRTKDIDVLYLSFAVQHLSPREKYKTIEKMILQLRDLPEPVNRAVAYALHGYSPSDSPECRAFLERLTAADDKHIRQAAAELRERIKVAATTPPNTSGVAGPGPGGVKITPIALSVEGRGPAPPRHLKGLLSVGSEVDVLWSRDAVYVMKAKGKCRLVWRAPGQNVELSTVTFDGKYLWATAQRLQANTTLLVIDPQTEAVWDVSSAEGLPRAPAKEAPDSSTTPALMTTPLAQGRACLVGSFFGRAWVVVATFDASSGKAAVKVIHEAKDAPDRTVADQWKKTTVGFTPRFVATLNTPAAGGAKPEQRVVVGRAAGESIEINVYPLVIDPDRGTAEVLTRPVWVESLQYRSLVVDGTLCYLQLPDPPQRGGLTRLALARLEPDVFAEGPLSQPRIAGTWLATHGGQFHVILETSTQAPRPGSSSELMAVRRYQWVTVGLDGKNPRLVASGLESLDGVWVSSHYGLVTQVVQGGAKPSLLNTVEIVPPKK